MYTPVQLLVLMTVQALLFTIDAHSVSTSAHSIGDYLDVKYLSTKI